MKVLYFGIYDPGYARNWVLINGLKKNGVEILELRQKPGRFALFKLFFSYLKFKQNYDAMVVGFPGQEVMFLARLLVWNKPIIFDAFTSHYGGYILDRKRWAKKSIRAHYFRFLDKWSCKLADVVLLDTDAHINFFVKEYGLNRNKFKRIFVGVPHEDDLKTEIRPNSNKFKVTFFGTYIPLQGIGYIIKAAKLLEANEEIVFNLIGDGQERKKNENLAKELELKHLKFQGILTLEMLRKELTNSDICLGVFGDSPKTALVIPNKVYEAVSLGKPVITADTEAIRELFDENEMLLIPPANEKALADAILELKNNQDLRNKLAVNGHKKFKMLASYEVLGRELKEILFVLNDTRKLLPR